MNFKPLNDRILVKRLTQENKTKGGILLPDSVGEKPQEAKVIAVGSDSEKPLSVQIDDVVVFGKFSGTEITLDGEEYLIIDQKDILGIKQ